MKKNYFALLLAVICLAAKSNAQQVTPCYTDQVQAKLIAAHPEILQIQAKLEKEIAERLKGIDYNKVARTTADSFIDQSGNPDFWYDIPVVIHIIHDYGQEYISDDSLISYFNGWNTVYAKENADTSDVIAPYKGFIPNSNVRYIGNPHIRLHLATIDPNGNPTKGITRHRSYLTYTASDQAKLDDWPPSSYVNIWSVNIIPASGGFQAAAYAYQPPSAAGDPQGDGILCDYSYMPNSPYNSGEIGKTINHEMGHVFNLYHPWGGTNFPQVAIGSDLVDDTPPTWGHNPVGCIEYPDATAVSSNDNSVYDTLGATNYYVIYPSANGGDSLVNYPDTTNAQNIMDYTYCSRMFTAGQVARMHAALNSNVAGRNNLWDSTNLSITGAMAPLPDDKPIPAFNATPTTGSISSTTYMDMVKFFTFPSSPILFTNESWNDTLTALNWTFNVGGTSQTSTSKTTASVEFTQGGWVSLSMTATGNNTGDSTITWPRAVFVSNTAATSGQDYIQEFSGADTAQWPMFNYYNNEFYWQMANVGMYDHNSIEYVGYDSRIDVPNNIFPQTGPPGGDFDDIFSAPFDLSGFGSGPCYLNFNYSGASRTNTDIDEMDIDYAVKTSSGMSAWTNLTKIKAGLDNKGAVSTPWVPSSPQDWAPCPGYLLPAAAKTTYTVFRFRYMPGNDPATNNSGGNNFYMDRVTFGQWPAAVNNVKTGGTDVTVLPNPTSGDAFVVVNDADNETAQIIVMDVTGKVVYKTSQQVTGSQARIQIPHSAISVQGMYIVQTITGNQANTQKLVVE